MSEDVIVGIGSATDCNRLIDSFCETEDFRFSVFAEKWKLLNFDLIFCGRGSEEEVLILTRELINISKNLLLESDNSINNLLYRRVGALYLVYGIYYKQNKVVKIRFTMSDIKEVICFLEKIQQENLKEPEFVFYKLFFDNAFIFAASPNEFVHQNSKRNTTEDGEQVDYSIDAECTLLDCEGVSLDNLGQIEALQYKYEEMKSQLPELGKFNDSTAINKHFVPDLLNSLANLKTKIQINSKRNQQNHNNDQDENQGTDGEIHVDYFRTAQNKARRGNRGKEPSSRGQNSNKQV